MGGGKCNRERVPESLGTGVALFIGAWGGAGVYKGARLTQMGSQNSEPEGNLLPDSTIA